MHNDRVRHVMTESVLSIRVETPVSELLRLMAEYPVHHLPVLDDGGVCGMLSSADMLKLEHFLPKSGPPSSLINERFHIRALMRQPVLSIGPDESIGAAAELMSAHGIHALRVVNGVNHLVGIVTTTDIMAGLLRRLREVSGNSPAQSGVPPVAHDRTRTIAAAHDAIASGTDRDGVAGLALFLYQRNASLEALRNDVARYLKFGHDGQLEARLLKDLDRLDREVPQQSDL